MFGYVFIPVSGYDTLHGDAATVQGQVKPLGEHLNLAFDWLNRVLVVWRFYLA